MAITPYRTSNDPFDRLFNTLMGGGGHSAGGGSLMRAPETDVIESEDEIRVLTEMPGLKRDDIEIDVENNVLTISGEKREERTEEEEGRYHLAERRYGMFSRSFVLPRDVDPERIEASFEDGVLNVRIPKSERARRRRIEVSGSAGGRQEIQARTGNQESEEQRTGGKKK